METIEWSDKFSVNVDSMDAHHKKILHYLAGLQLDSGQSDDALKIADTLKELADYASFHFSEEENLMRDIGFPDLAVQVNQHAYFINEVREMFIQLETGTLPARSVISFIRDWFIHHIMQEDFKYGQMLKSA